MFAISARTCFTQDQLEESLLDIRLADQNDRRRSKDAESTLACLPCLYKCDVGEEGAHNHTPLPSDTLVFEDNGVDGRNVDDGERDDETCNHSPHEEAVVDTCFDDGEWTCETTRIKVEE